MALKADITGLAKKAFVCDVDTHLGRALCQKLSADYEISGTTVMDSDEPQKWTSALVQRDQAHLLKKTILDSDLVVVQLLGQENVVDATAALKVLMNSHYENEKTFILVSSVMTWFETQQAAEKEAEEAKQDEEEGEEAEGEPEEKEQPTYTESDYNKRVPHVKYQDWKEVEKLCKKANSDTLHTYCIFAGLPYGRGEDKLHPLFKQAWHLRPEGLPCFGTGSSIVPMVHVDDLSNFVFKLAETDPLPQRYFFGVDNGNCSWNDVIKAINSPEGGMGTGKVNRVPPRDFVLYENVEHFIINLKLEPDGKMGDLLGDEWKCQSGLVENIGLVVNEYKQARGVTPLRVCILGPPASGKSHYSRVLAKKYKLPHVTILDVIQDYENQCHELQEELERLKRERKEDKIKARLKRLKEELKEKKKAEREAAAAADGGGDEEGSPDAEAAQAEDEDDYGDDDDFIFDDELEQELAKEEAEEGGAGGDDEDDPDEARVQRKEELEKKLGEVKMVLALKEKEKKEDGDEPPDPKKKGKPADKGKPKKEPQSPAEEDDRPKPPPRYTPKALAFMVQWRLRHPNCRNQGFILDGYPRTVKEARFLFEDGLPGPVPEEPGEEDDEPPALEPGEVKRVDDAFFPDFIVQLRASDTFLTERVQKIQDQPHTAPEDFQRRLEAYKVNNPARDRSEPPREPDKSLSAWMECSLTNRMQGEQEDPREAQLRGFDVDKCPLTPLPPPATLTEEAERAKQVDEVCQAMQDFIGEPHNYGPSPQEIAEGEDRQRRIEQEQEEQRQLAELQRQQREKEEKESQLRLRQQEEERLAAMKAEEKEMLEIRKEPLKEYLMANIIPVLTKGLIEVCEQRPEDPIDYLAEWLFHHNPVEDQDI
eukprot:TRINITY_DN49916_c0_g1_i1.p1 TRINITY_DN49916_c0_g1~~TRINITY_DN49916_c0_g1_i1.p1  ORF type:complete len:909 (+),score=488.48 TRINITY_DN49916_c0_g1_i1:96-2729(+)